MDTLFRIIANKDGSNAHAVSYYGEAEQSTLCWDRPRLGKNEVGSVMGYEGVARFHALGVTLCADCRRNATSIAATARAEEARAVAALALVQANGADVTLSAADLVALLAAVSPIDADTLDYDPSGHATGGGNGFLFRRYEARTGRTVSQPVQA